MKRKVSVCAGVVAAMVGFSAGAEETRAAAAPPAASAPASVAAPAEVPVGPASLSPAPLVEATVAGGATAAARAPAAGASAAAAQAPEAQAQAEASEVHVPVSVTLLPNISTSGMHTGNVVTNFTLGLLATHAKRVDGMALSLGANWVEEGGLDGAQLAVGANVAGGAVTGAQFGVGANVAAGSLSGAQLAVGANIARGPMHGLQAAAGVNVARQMRGLQMSSGISYARELDGGQLSIINVGGDVDGAQVGIVNVGGKVNGAQVGIVNVARELDGEAVGLLSFVGNGQANLQAWASDIAYTNLAVKFGGRHLHTLLTAGFNPGTDTHRRRYTFGLGFGVHIPVDALFFDLDVVGNTVHTDNLFQDGDGNNVLGQLRLVAGYQLARRFSIIGGVTGNTLVTWDGSDRWEELGIGPEWRNVSDNGRTTVRVWPGVMLGVQI